MICGRFGWGVGSLKSVCVESISCESAEPAVRFNPTFTIEGMSVVLHPLELVSVGTDKLGEVVHSLAEAGQQVIDALDELITRAHG